MASAAAALQANRSLGRVPSLLLFAVVASVYLLTASWSFVASGDVVSAGAQAWTVATTGEPWMENSPLWGVEGVGEPTQNAPNGREVVPRMIGGWLPAVPAYALFSVFGAGEFSQAPMAMLGALTAAGATLLMAMALVRIVSVPAALAATAVFAFGTPTWTVSADVFWTHSLTQFAIAGAAWACATRRWLLVGLFLGFGALARAHVLVVAAVLGIGLSVSTRTLSPVVRVGLGSVLGAAALSVSNRIVLGTWSPLGVKSGIESNLVNAERNAVLLESLAGFLVSPLRGILLWTPVLLLLLPSLVRHARHAPPWTLWLALGGVAYALIQLRVNVWHGGDRFTGYRHGLELVTSITPLFAYAADRASRRVQRAALVVGAVQIAIMLLLATSGHLLYQYQTEDLVWSSHPIVPLVQSAPLVVALTIGIFAVGALVLGRRLELEGPDQARGQHQEAIKA